MLCGVLTIKSRTWARRSNISCEISSHRGINISQAEQVGASKPLLAIDNCRGHELKQRTNPTFVSFLCPGRLLAQRTRLHSAAHSGSRGRRAEERAAAIRTENRILEREL